MKKNMLSKNMRISKSREIFFILKHAKKIYSPWIIFFYHRNIFVHPRIGLIVLKKYIYLSHDRNRIKRLIKESFRLNQFSLIKSDFLAYPKKNILKYNNHVLKKKLNILWQNYFYL
ncbi:protein C5 component of RNase P [Wigglesworthia glossinidia endosymbiont of Glossina morsitans morsitans (Yale colony)]|uniref:Ribonuclease P protein component n=1 Tax=Wigglesworthia glossinidia endosymbiont of Glossina morsitans morsitans (Yale colony) TaxID=1142511 RepID=H6Q494_WIGGL|nr:ribonuclease P protein component [Wigglesworthia glossinidia]AFA40877.1 protein C5 component of RNase P [Wigglesworthia glossinidia endosymbiont of Glossina morsitans morsitans (Yale colony)]